MKSPNLATPPLSPSPSQFSLQSGGSSPSASCHSFPLSPHALTACWACDVTLRVPTGDDGEAVPQFKCGWCGALTRTSSGAKPPDKADCCAGAACRRLRRGTIAFLSSVLILIVTVLIASIIGVGVRTVLPLVCGESVWLWGVHMAVTVALAFNVFFNYFNAVLRNPGSPAALASAPKLLRGGSLEDVTVPQGAFAGYSFCSKCNSGRPPSAHHCRICEQCILDMDHHCPFIGRCVGRGNLRNFLLFLIYATTACAYVTALCCWIFYAQWTVIGNLFLLGDATGRAGLKHSLILQLVDRISAIAAKQEGKGRFMFLRYAGAFADLLFQRHIPVWFYGLLYEITAASLVMATVGFLLWQQYERLSSGQTYIDYLQERQARHEGRCEHGHEGRCVSKRQRFANFRAVFGPGHPLLWLLPRFNPVNQHRSSWSNPKKQG